MLPNEPFGPLRYKGIYLKAHFMRPYFAPIWSYWVFAKHADSKTNRFSNFFFQERSSLRTLAHRHIDVSATKLWPMKQSPVSSPALRTERDAKRLLTRLLSRCAIVVVAAWVRRATRHASRRARSRRSLSNLFTQSRSDSGQVSPSTLE